jgi:hypothetical protein
MSAPPRQRQLILHQEEVAVPREAQLVQFMHRYIGTRGTWWMCDRYCQSQMHCHGSVTQTWQEVPCAPGSYESVAKKCKKSTLKGVRFQWKWHLAEPRLDKSYKLITYAQSHPWLALKPNYLQPFWDEQLYAGQCLVARDLSWPTPLLNGRKHKLPWWSGKLNTWKTVQMMTHSECLASVTGKSFAEGTPTLSPEKRPSGLTVKEMIGVAWKTLPTCMTEYMIFFIIQGW